MLATTILDIVNYFKKPVFEKDPNKRFSYRLKKSLSVLFIMVTVRMLNSTINRIFFHFDITKQFSFNITETTLKMAKKLNDVFPTMSFDQVKLISLVTIFFTMIIISPVIKEIFFRAPLTIIKKQPFFKYIFYLSAFLYTYFHINSFGDITYKTLLLSPILLAGIGVFGMILGYVRVKFNFLWCISLAIAFEFLYSLFNFILWR